MDCWWEEQAPPGIPQGAPGGSVYGRHVAAYGVAFTAFLVLLVLAAIAAFAYMVVRSRRAGPAGSSPIWVSARALVEASILGEVRDGALSREAVTRLADRVTDDTASRYRLPQKAGGFGAAACGAAPLQVTQRSLTPGTSQSTNACRRYGAPAVLPTRVALPSHRGSAIGMVTVMPPRPLRRVAVTRNLPHQVLVSSGSEPR